MEVVLTIKFDGKNFKDGSKTVANYYNDKIYEGSSRSKALCNIYGDKVYEGTSRSKQICNVYNDKIYEGSSRSKTLIRIKDAQKVVDGNMNDATIAAAWFVLK